MSRRLTALVIGNAAYLGMGKLKNAANDAHDVAARLETLGFSVLKVIDCSNKEMDVALKTFKKSLVDNEVGLFFFAGHGMQIEGDNYLIALDTDTVSETDAKHSSLSLNKLIETMEKAGTSSSFIILDACRDNPFESAWHRSSATRGLAPVYAPRGTLIAFATSPGQVASDGSKRNGAYTAALLQHVDTPDCSIESMFKRVRNTLSASTKQKQISWEHTSLSGEFFFNLSLGARIDHYSLTALSDGLLVLDDARASHRLIRELKTNTWPRQNPALDGFTPDVAKKFNTDSLFVIGRNIYQAACGSAKSAVSYLNNFMSRSQGMGKDKRKELLDGILFEIFFDSNGQLRDQIKGRFFNEAFHLQKYPELSGSFDFIAECLVTQADRFHAIPGKMHPVAVDVTTQKKGVNAHAVEAVYLGAVNILWLEDEDFADDDGQPLRYQTMDRSEFERRLAEEMAVPFHLLTVTYSSGKNGPHHVQFPRGCTTRKRRD